MGGRATPGCLAGGAAAIDVAAFDLMSNDRRGQGRRYRRFVEAERKEGIKDGRDDRVSQCQRDEGVAWRRKVTPRR